ncbi:MAG: LysR family transcriptional regulator [Gammaproteobacteria bacterium]|nr:LysR family transcriptional regulator [Gammaproteobacteria bacterium]
MDIDLLKTFVEVYHTRHFARAADNLFITPSAVSARIRQLESQLGTELFVRERSNIQLTRAGERFLGHARGMLKTWELACYEVAVDADPRPGLTLLVVPGLWDGIRLDWLRELQDQQPDMSLRVETLNSSQIATRLQQNSADLGLMLEPVAGPELQLQQLGELELVMVSARPGQSVSEALADRYVLVDWNTSFHAQHANAFPAAPTPRTWVSTGRLAYDLLLSTGGAAYLPVPMVADAQQERRLHAVASAPRISLRIYAASAIWSERGALIRQVLDMFGASF